MNAKHKSLALKILPVVLLLSTLVVFRFLGELLGPKSGYFGGFLFYWFGWCFIFPYFLLGKKDFLRMFQKTITPLTTVPLLGATLLFLAPLFTIGYAMPLLFPRLNLVIIAASLALAIINATAEEILWRGTYFSIFPHSPFLGVIYPALGFAVWHYAPQTIHASSYPGGAHSLVLFSLILGLMWGYVAWKTKSIRWTVLAHIILNFSGMGALFYLS